MTKWSGEELCGSAGGFPRIELARGVASPLRRLRRAADVSQVRLAAAIERSQSYVSDLERGRVIPTRKDLEVLRSIFGVDFSVYFPLVREMNG